MKQAIKNRINRIQQKMWAIRVKINQINEQVLNPDVIWFEDAKTPETLPLLDAEAKLEAMQDRLVKKVTTQRHPIFGWDYPRSIKKRREWKATLCHKRIPMFATKNDTDKWALAIDGVFGFCKSQQHAYQLFETIGEIGESPFGCCQVLPPHYCPINGITNQPMDEAKLSDYDSIDIDLYLQRYYEACPKFGKFTKNG